ncbi:efflux RND transporter periplasmic adaptor subunit [Chloracidobacterium sp. D]|jgi:RND family efflux transporter MFP subunit|uniref:efflux RND transporter periplasmic adaptor subunit n=1 Tax=Chloracidobacterium sp. D TaxID=2821536 RepID=UPI001B8CDF1D|nr:efflux RND transporter periplasmic adaptor subunit [Chloracidobacterium sp. D]QUV83592.1 efflux RND transporter periplasmic adaptor subunit [Chloracidobacterium sp. D]
MGRREGERLSVCRCGDNGIAAWVVGGLCLVALVLGGGCQRPAQNQASAATEVPTPVTVARVQVRMRPQSILATGNVVPWRQSAVASAAMGKVVDIPVDVGAVVREGQVLARLDDREARQRLAQAEAALAQAEAAEAQLRARLGLSGEVFDPRQTPEAEAAQAALTAAEAEARLAGATLERYERLARHDNITRAVLDEARTRLEAAQAQVQAARRRYAATLDGLRAEYAGLRAAQARIAEARAAVALAQKAVEDTTVRAPFAGYVAERFANVGEYVTPEKPLMELVVLERLKLELQVPAGEAGRVRRGQAVEATTDAYPDWVIRGEVTTIRPLVEADARRLRVEVIVSNGEQRLRPGMFVTARLLLPERTPWVMAPRAAVRWHPGLGAQVAYVVEGDRARLRVVQVGENVGEEVEIRSGLEAGERVVVTGLEKLEDGKAVSSTDR